MITRPSTEQIILDCRKELLEFVGPEVTSDAGKVKIQMLENVLRNVAMRAAHEIAWMREETAEMEKLARDTLAAAPTATTIAEALRAYESGPRESLHLDDVSTVYSLAGEAFSCALETALGNGLTELQARGAALLATRSAHEVQIMGEWGFVGRG